MQTSSLNSSSANNNIRKLCSDLLELVGSTLFNDVEISTKSGTVVSAHAVLLAARCPALKKVRILVIIGVCTKHSILCSTICSHISNSVCISLATIVSDSHVHMHARAHTHTHTHTHIHTHTQVLSCSNSRPIRLDFTDYEDSVVLNFLRFIYTGSLPPATSTENMEHPLVDLAHK